MFSTSHSRYSLPWWISKAFAVKWRILIAWICSQRIEICFKIGAEGSFWSCCSGERMFSVFYQQDLRKALFIRCLFMQRVLQVPCNGRPSLLSRLAKKGGLVGNTRPSLPHAKMLLVPFNCFLCWSSKCEFWPLKIYLILRGRDAHINFLWSAWFALWCKSIFFLGPFRNVKLFIAAD